MTTATKPISHRAAIRGLECVPWCRSAPGHLDRDLFADDQRCKSRELKLPVDAWTYEDKRHSTIVSVAMFYEHSTERRVLSIDESETYDGFQIDFDEHQMLAFIEGLVLLGMETAK